MSRVGKDEFSPKGRAGATNGRETGNACEIPNRTGKNNIINYGSLEPPPACGGAICLRGLAPRATVRSASAGPGAPPPRHPGGGAIGPRDSSGLGAAGRACCGAGRAASTGSPLSPAPAGAPSAGAALRAGPRGHQGRAWAPEQPATSARARGARRLVDTPGRPSGPAFPPGPEAEGEVKVTCGGGGGARARLGPQLRPQPRP